MRLESGFKRGRSEAGTEYAYYPEPPSKYMHWSRPDLAALPPIPSDGAFGDEVYRSGDVEVVFDKDSKLKDKMVKKDDFKGFFQVKKGGGVHIEL